VLESLRKVPREVSVDRSIQEFAYEDSPPSTSEGQTISQPYIVALMRSAAELKQRDRVLEA
jgi:protein-L-isoaspartate(D-aspartate) O-methyltransferase